MAIYLDIFLLLSMIKFSFLHCNAHSHLARGDQAVTALNERACTFTSADDQPTYFNWQITSKSALLSLQSRISLVLGCYRERELGLDRRETC